MKVAHISSRCTLPDVQAGRIRIVPNALGLDCLYYRILPLSNQYDNVKYPQLWQPNILQISLAAQIMKKQAGLIMMSIHDLMYD
jgi:hypothetical protein